MTKRYFILFVIFILNGCVSSKNITDCESKKFMRYGEINRQQNMSLGERIYDSDFNHVFSSIFNGMANIGVSIKNMERESGYILAEGMDTRPTSIQIKTANALVRELSECGRTWEARNGNAIYSYTFSLRKLQNDKVKVKLRVSLVVNQNQGATLYSSFHPKLLETHYQHVWRNIEQQIFLDTHLENN